MALHALAAALTAALFIGSEGRRNSRRGHYPGPYSKAAYEKIKRKKNIAKASKRRNRGK